MKLKKTLALGLVAAMAASFTACGSSASSTAAESTASGEAAAEAATDAPDGDGDPTTLTVAMECAYAPTTGPRAMTPTALLPSAEPATTPTATTL